MVTQDIRFRVMAEDWQRTGRTFAGLVFGHQRYVSFGQLISDLELIAKAIPIIGETASSSFRFDQVCGATHL